MWHDSVQANLLQQETESAVRDHRKVDLRGRRPLATAGGAHLLGRPLIPSEGQEGRGEGDPFERGGRYRGVAGAGVQPLSGVIISTQPCGKKLLR